MKYLERFPVDFILFAENSQKFHHDISISLKNSWKFPIKNNWSCVCDINRTQV